MVYRRFILGGAFVLCLLALISCVTGHSKSWQYGYHHADFAIKFQEHGVSVKFACAAAASAFLIDEKDLDRDEVIAGCVQGVNDAAK